MNRFSLQFQNKAMEAEYVQLKRLTIAESVRIMLFFLGLVQLTTGVPALIDRNYTAFGASIALIVSFLMISFLGKGLRNYRQLMAFLVQAIFQFSRPYYVPDEIHNSSINGIFRGFSFASIQLSIMSRFPSWNQKALGVVLSFIIKFLLTGFVDNTIFDASTVVRNVLNSLFVLYVFYSNEKTERLLFKGYHEHREKLAKFKELVENYLPQSIIILNPSKKKCFFANQAFLQTFKEYESLQENTKILDYQENTHADFQNLTVDTDTLTQLGPEEGLVTKFPENSSVLQQFLEEYANNYSVNYKALSFSASGVIEGARRLFGVTATKLKWDGENALGVVLRDITYQESLIALKVANENKDNILATVSHELRTPLNGIIGILGITQKKIKNTEVLEHLDLCKDNAQLLLGLVNSLLDLQQIKKGSLKLNITKVHIQKVLKDIQRLFQYQCDQKAIFLSHHIDPNIPTHINTDENRLKQILINLVGNALKFTSQGGISLEVTHDRSSSEHLVISVRDTGIGIKETDIGKLFKMYGKLKDGESINKNGVGLGLMISNALAQLLGQNGYGDGIEVDSKFGKGTQFSFKLAKDLNKSQERRKDNETTIIEGKKGFETESSFDKELLNSEYEDQLLAANRSRMSNYTFTKSMAVPDRGPHLMLERDVNEEELKLDESIHIGPTKGEILVVDDNPFNLLIAGNLIKQIGYSFNSAKSGSEAIEILKTRLQSLQPFKAILMDCLMPIMDGYETTKVLTTLMEQKQVPQVPIIALTANKEEEDMKKCLECGMTDYLTKPLLIENLEKMLGKFAE